MPDFSVLVGSSEIASFSELQGITTEIKTIDYVEGRDDPVLYLNRFTCLPASSRTNLPATYRLRLVKRSDSNVSLRSWHRQATNSLAGRKDCILEVHGSQSQPIVRYHLENAWPSKIERFFGVTTTAGDEAMEKITIACERIERR